MSQIALLAKNLLPEFLHPVVDNRMEQGKKTYGQYLDNWDGTHRRAQVMRLQEKLDDLNYALFAGEYLDARDVAQEIGGLIARMRRHYPDLTAEELLEREPEVTS